jgi:hypothetical protein
MDNIDIRRVKDRNAVTSVTNRKLTDNQITTSTDIHFLYKF